MMAKGLIEALLPAYSKLSLPCFNIGRSTLISPRHCLLSSCWDYIRIPNRRKPVAR